MHQTATRQEFVRAALSCANTSGLLWQGDQRRDKGKGQKHKRYLINPGCLNGREKPEGKPELASYAVCKCQRGTVPGSMHPRPPARLRRTHAGSQEPRSTPEAAPRQLGTAPGVKRCCPWKGTGEPRHQPAADSTQARPGSWSGDGITARGMLRLGLAQAPGPPAKALGLTVFRQARIGLVDPNQAVWYLYGSLRGATALTTPKQLCCRALAAPLLSKRVTGAARVPKPVLGCLTPLTSPEHRSMPAGSGHSQL